MDPEAASKGEAEGAEVMEDANKEPSYEDLQRMEYLDPEGGYANPAMGLEAEKKAMMSRPPIHVNALPTKMYLE